MPEVDRQRAPLNPQIFRTALTTLGVNFDFVRNLLTFRQAGKPRPFNRADVNEHIVSAIIGLDEAKTLLAIEPFDSTCRHLLSPKHISREYHAIPFNWRCLWERARRRIQKGTAANRTIAVYEFLQQIQVHVKSIR